jgi:GT2 family glycosyltransferase
VSGTRTACVSIFIPTWNDGPDLADCLDSLTRLDYPLEKVEIVIWDNNSQDDTSELVKRVFREMEPQGWLTLRLIRSPRNEGSYIPYNLAENALSPETEFILGLDADIEVAPDVLTHLVATAQDGSAGVVGARSVYFDHPDQTAHAAGFVNRWTAKYSEQDAATPITCDYVIGCCWLLNRKLFHEVGGFDPDFFINHWEVEYCLRVQARGYRIRYEPRAVVRHRISLGGARKSDRLYYNYRNKLLMIRKSPYFPRRRLAATACVLMSSARIALAAIAARRFGEAAISFRGVYDGIRGRIGRFPLDQP